jgi:F0F1-type ATP synthase assembly protein I
MTDDKPSPEGGASGVLPDSTVASNLTPPASSTEVFSATAAPGLPPVLSHSQLLGVQIGPAPQIGDAIVAKLKDEHLSKIIDHSESENKRKSGERIHSMYLACGSIAGILVFILILSYLFLRFQKAELLQPLITGILGFAAGALSGYGYGRSTSSKGDADKK